ncbi:MAG: hypothetical protein WCO08_04070 [Actinomycetes bacterium]
MELDQGEILAVRDLIADIGSKPLSEHVEEFERVHGQLLRALSEIDGM